MEKKRRSRSLRIRRNHITHRHRKESDKKCWIRNDESIDNQVGVFEEENDEDVDGDVCLLMILCVYFSHNIPNQVKGVSKLRRRELEGCFWGSSTQNNN